MAGSEGLELAGRDSGTDMLALSALTIAGYLTFVVGLLAGKISGNRELLGAVAADERVRAIRGDAFTWGFSAMLVFQVLVLVGVPVVGRISGVAIPAEILANLSIGTGIVAAFSRYLWLDR